MGNSSIVEKHAETARVCAGCGKPLQKYWDVVSDVKNGKRGLFHYSCMGDMSSFSTWFVIIDATCDDGKFRNRKSFELSVSANSREGAIEAALAQFKVETRPEILEYRVMAFPGSE